MKSVQTSLFPYSFSKVLKKKVTVSDLIFQGDFFFSINSFPSSYLMFILFVIFISLIILFLILILLPANTPLSSASLISLCLLYPKIFIRNTSLPQPKFLCYQLLNDCPSVLPKLKQSYLFLSKLFVLKWTLFQSFLITYMQCLGIINDDK